MSEPLFFRVERESNKDLLDYERDQPLAVFDLTKVTWVNKEPNAIIVGFANGHRMKLAAEMISARVEPYRYLTSMLSLMGQGKITPDLQVLYVSSATVLSFETD